MNREELFSALNGIKEEYLNEASSYELRRRQRRARILRIALPAAAVVAMLAMTTVATLPFLTRPSKPLVTDPPSVLDQNPQPAPDVPPPQYSEGLVYEKREDHAVIVQLQGDGQVAHIPQFLDNLPVTKVELSEGTIPQNYTTLSFNGEMLEALTLPKNQEMTLNIGKNVTMIHPSSLMNTSLTAVVVDEENPTYASYKGILYSKDLTELIACPAGLQATSLSNSGGHEILNVEKDVIQIPDETVKIGDRAFKNNVNLIDITLPEGISDIGRAAFENCVALRSLTLPSSIENISKDVFNNAANLGYLHYPKGKEAFLDLDIILPIGCQVYYPLAESDPDLDIAPFIKFFTEAEECIAWFSRFHFIPCDGGSEVDGYYPVTMEGVSTLAELRAYLEKYFDQKLLDSLFEENANSDEPVFKEIDGALYMMPADIPVSYTDGERQYSLTDNKDGTISVTVRVNVPGTVANICVDSNYLIVCTENGYCFAEGFILPVEKWYPLYLVNSQ